MKKIVVGALIFTLILVLVGCSGGYDSGLYDIYGKITVDQSDIPIEGAKVEVGKYSDFTNSDGYYRINDIPQGYYLWRVTTSNYHDYSEYIYVSSNRFISHELKPITGNGRVYGRVDIHNETKYYQLQGESELNVDKLPLKTNNNKTEYKESEIIVKYKSVVKMQSIDKMESKHSIQKLNQLNTSNGEIINYKIPEEKDVQEMVNYYNDLPEVEWAEPNYKYYLTSVPNDDYYSDQWGHVNVNLEAAWDIEKGNYATTVAVIDSGIIPEHPDLQNNIGPGYDFVDYDNDPKDETSKAAGGSHGTHVAGIIGAVTNNSRGVAGVNWNVNIMPLRVFDSYGTAYEITAAIDYAIDNGADVINLSLGGDPSSSIHNAIQRAVDSGVVVCASAGNGGEDGVGDPEVLYPAAYPEVIAVGAVDKYNERASYSNYGPELDLVAPGGSSRDGGILSTWGYYDMGQTSADYKYMEGTSMAAPYVSGVAALLISNGVSNYSVKNRLIDTAVDLGYSGHDNYYGWGLVDAYGALLGRKLESPYVFAASFDGDDIYIESEITVLEDDGTYNLSEVNSGYLNIVAWRDVNRNGVIDGGDYYGESDTVYVIDYIEKNVDLDMYYVTKESEIYGTSVLGIEEFETDE